MDASLILYALVAGGLVFWLRSILGTRTGDERERPNPFTAPPANDQSKPLHEAKGQPQQAEATILSLSDDLQPSLPRNVTIASDEISKTLFEIARADRSFDPAKFCENAQDAFIMIVEAFADGDRDLLRDLVEPQVYAAFDKAIASREERGEFLSTEIHAVRKMEILDARFDGRQALITARFIADETCVIRSEDGAVLSGDPDRITEMNDIWTFARLVKNREPIWLLHETRDGDVVEEHKTPLPDSGA